MCLLEKHLSSQRQPSARTIVQEQYAGEYDYVTKWVPLLFSWCEHVDGIALLYFQTLMRSMQPECVGHTASSLQQTACQFSFYTLQQWLRMNHMGKRFLCMKKN